MSDIFGRLVVVVLTMHVNEDHRVVDDVSTDIRLIVKAAEEIGGQNRWLCQKGDHNESPCVEKEWVDEWNILEGWNDRMC